MRSRTAAVSVSVAFCAALAACAPKGSSKHAYVADRPLQLELMEADRAFARDVSDRGLDAWLDAFADDGIQLPAGQPMAQGKTEVRAVMVPLLTDPTTKLRWEPETASVSASGDLGYTVGYATVSKVGPSGGEVVFAKLKYLTVWKRQLDGHWRIAAEVGTAEP